jgi:hypothetical protein
MPRPAVPRRHRPWGLGPTALSRPERVERGGAQPAVAALHRNAHTYLLHCLHRQDARMGQEPG